MKPLEMWGGIECTYNRVEHSYHDQLEKNGHGKRLEDLALIADLGIKKIRYPLLWEKISPSENEFHWDWADERLNELKRLNLSPIAGFLHHGSGPLHTSLIDPEFPQKLARFAGEFARRYPWVMDYTPINEILTTARFSCLYGHWYPHKKDDFSFLKAVVLQCKATILTMREIRKYNPAARLIQTDDMGKCQSTPVLKYQCDFENERRFLAYDLLCGKVNKEHPIYEYVSKFGVTDEDLQWFVDNSCPPDVLGLNHYHLSNRWLDDEMEHYPEWSHGGNGKHRYADVGAVDSGRVEPPAPEVILRETWERFRLPIAITEVHMRGTRENQMRWLNQMWEASKTVREEGVNVEGVTVWSLLGTYDWHTLCTRNEMFYEPGVFDLRSVDKKPRHTGLSHLVKELATFGKSVHPLLKETGHWHLPRRILFGASYNAFSPYGQSTSRPVLITGRNGTLGQAFARICGERNIPYKILSRAEMDITNADQVRSTIEALNPWAVINTAGFVRVDEAEEMRDQCFLENVLGPETLAKVSAEFDIPLVTFSSDLVFDGKNGEAYVESHPLSPINTYGESKAKSEEVVLSLHPDTLVIRTSSFFGPWDHYNFVKYSLETLKNGKSLEAAADIKVSPTYVPDLVNETLDLLIDGERGVHHVTNDGAVTWAELAQLAVKYSGMSEEKTSLIIPKSANEMKFLARRPVNSVLATEKRNALPPLEDALKRFFIQTETLT